MSILTLDNVSKKYSNKVALKNINFSLDKNCIVGLVGPNGAGKTTLFRLIMNLIEPTTGKIKLWDQNNSTNIVGNNINYCSDGDNLYEDLTVSENLQFIVRAYGINNGNKKIEELSILLDIDQELNTQAKNLSKGMRKKVALIRTLINEASMIILDEPMSWLDVDNQKRLTMLLKSMSKKSLIIISSHNMAQVEKICDKVILLNQEIKYFGDIEDIDYGNIIKLKIEYVKESYNPQLKKELISIVGVLDVYSVDEALYIEYDNSIGDIENQIISCVIQRYKLNVKKINHIEKSLEDLYFERVR
ncbi:ABC-2 type transport system ATP-binding protein [Alkalibaculum bacchi]|uniref:ABC-2 type transport system ATP-binding protein n=1 Tax=Alkalibaculum bacchi TaxID=645887 RepID=A0A366I8L7_9FIRM|nr:ABC transporter ATP-binding protein [Alkalibaculum bacchi]RBP65362.1 ABC-2 type transport system ATP-binding protein [Alkalibaculum bacchi]